MQQPLISVVMPVYNAACYVGEAIESILSQTYPHFEFIIVVDESSKDDSANIVLSLEKQDPRISSIFVSNLNKAQALNLGIKSANGELIAYMDADDLALPERFYTQLTWMHNSGVDVCGCNAQRIGEWKANSIHINWFPETHDAIKNELLFRCLMYGSSVMIRACVAKENLYNEEILFDTYSMWTRLALQYQLGNVPQVLIKYRYHNEQITKREKTKLDIEFKNLQRAYFEALFPNSKTDDYLALSRVMHNKPHTNITELHKAGMWLLDLSKTPDNYLRKKMLKRWQSSCLRSAHLGMAVYHLYRQVAPQFGVTLRQKEWRLMLMCLLRQNKFSKPYQVLRRLKMRNGFLGRSGQVGPF